MTVWLVLAGLTAATLALMLMPVLRGRGAAAGRGAYDLAVYRDQLVELDRDLEHGLLSADQAEAARLEIQRRVLAAGSAGAGARQLGRWPRLAVAGTIAVLVPAAALALYARLGTPGLADAPYGEAQARMRDVPLQANEQILAMVESLSARLAANPDDVAGWQLLGRSYRALNRLGEAADALRQAVRLGSTDPESYATLGEAIVLEGGGVVTAEAAEAFRTTLHFQPGEPRARFYLGMAKLQANDPMGALAIWRDLETDSGPQAPWLPFLRERMREVAAQTGIDPTAIPPQRPVSSEGGAVTAAGAAPQPSTGDTQSAMIRGMVEQLDAKLRQTPDDLDGWLRLGRSYRVLGDPVRARDAYAQAVALRPDDVQIKLDYADVLLLTAGEIESLPADYVGVMREVLDLAPDNADARYFVGLADMQSGRFAEARGHWSRLLDLLDPGSAEYQELKRQIDALPEG